MVNTVSYLDANQYKSTKVTLNLNCSLKLKNMKVELLVIFNHHVKVNCFFLVLYTPPIAGREIS